MRILTTFTLGLAMAVTPVVAAEQPGAKSEPKLICKRDKQGAETGSNFRGMGKRICRTEAQWDELERHAREAFRRIDETATRERGYVPPSQRGEN